MVMICSKSVTYILVKVVGMIQERLILQDLCITVLHSFYIHCYLKEELIVGK